MSYMFTNFIVFLFLIFRLISLWSENTLCMISILLSILKFALWSMKWYVWFIDNLKGYVFCSCWMEYSILLIRFYLLVMLLNSSGFWADFQSTSWAGWRLWELNYGFVYLFFQFYQSLLPIFCYWYLVDAHLVLLCLLDGLTLLSLYDTLSVSGNFHGFEVYLVRY
jgi:hypothetical protein